MGFYEVGLSLIRCEFCLVVACLAMNQPACLASCSALIGYHGTDKSGLLLDRD